MAEDTFNKHGNSMIVDIFQSIQGKWAKFDLKFLKNRPKSSIFTFGHSNDPYRSPLGMDSYRYLKQIRERDNRHVSGYSKLSQG